MTSRRFIACALAALIAGAAAIVSWAWRAEPSAARRRPNIILISLDTLRADRLGLHGYSRPTSPNLDLFGAGSVVFEKAVTVSNWTLPAHVSMFTGLYPSTHRVLDGDDKLTREIPVLAEILERAGYATLAFTGGGFLSRRFEMDRGFGVFEQSKSHTDLKGALRRSMKRIRDLDGSAPYFLFVHAYDIHCPYNVPAEQLGSFSSIGAEPVELGECTKWYNERKIGRPQALYLSDRYDERIRIVDGLLGSFFAFLAARDGYSDTIVAITSDHGEEFLEHGLIGHHLSLHRELLHVPLILRAPGFASRRVGAPTSLVDLFPTLLDLAGVEAPARMDGRSLRAVLRRGDEAATRPSAFSELDGLRVLRSAFGPRYHVIYDMLKNRGWLYDHETDPLEARDLSAERPELYRRLARELLRATPPSFAFELDPGTAEPLP